MSITTPPPLCPASARLELALESDLAGERRGTGTGTPVPRNGTVTQLLTLRSRHTKPGCDSQCSAAEWTDRFHCRSRHQNTRRYCSSSETRHRNPHRSWYSGSRTRCSMHHRQTTGSDRRSRSRTSRPNKGVSRVSSATSRIGYRARWSARQCGFNMGNHVGGSLRRQDARPRCQYSSEAID